MRSGSGGGGSPRAEASTGLQKRAGLRRRHVSLLVAARLALGSPDRTCPARVLEQVVETVRLAGAVRQSNAPAHQTTEVLRVLGVSNTGHGVLQRLVKFAAPSSSQPLNLTTWTCVCLVVRVPCFCVFRTTISADTYRRSADVRADDAVVRPRHLAEVKAVVKSLTMSRPWRYDGDQQRQDRHADHERDDRHEMLAGGSGSRVEGGGYAKTGAILGVGGGPAPDFAGWPRARALVRRDGRRRRIGHR